MIAATDLRSPGALMAQDRHWRTADGRALEIGRMEPEHARTVIRMLTARARQLRFAVAAEALVRAIRIPAATVSALHDTDSGSRWLEEPVEEDDGPDVSGGSDREWLQRQPLVRALRARAAGDA